MSLSRCQIPIVSRFKLAFWPMGKGLSFLSVAFIRERTLNASIRTSLLSQSIQSKVCLYKIHNLSQNHVKCPRKNSESLQFFFRCCWFACYFVSCLPGLLSQSCLQVPLPTERVAWTNNRAPVRLWDINGENPLSALVPFCSPEGKLLLLDKGSLQ